MNAEVSPREVGTHVPDIEALQRDIELANIYLLEKLKTMLAITTALLAFTVSVRPKLNPVSFSWAMVMGWIGLSVALLTGIPTMHAWDELYISYRNYNWKGQGAEGKQCRKVVDRWRRVFFTCQCVGFLVGIAGIGLFAAANIEHVRAQPGGWGPLLYMEPFNPSVVLIPQPAHIKSQRASLLLR